MSHLVTLVANEAKSAISEGTGRMTVFASSGQARTFNYQAGDVGQVSHRSVFSPIRSHFFQAMFLRHLVCHH